MKTETRAEHCSDWISVEEVVRMAVRSFVVARDHSKPPSGERFVDAGEPWSTREDFASNLAVVFELQVKSLAFCRAIGADTFEKDAVALAKWGIRPGEGC